MMEAQPLRRCVGQFETRFGILPTKSNSLHSQEVEGDAQANETKTVSYYGSVLGLFSTLDVALRGGYAVRHGTCEGGINSGIK